MGSCAAPSAKGDDKFITTDYLQQCLINAMARRSANFIARLSCEAPILFTGGVSHCQRFTHMLESHLGMPVQTHPDAQFAGAIGAAVIGQRQRKRA